MKKATHAAHMHAKATAAILIVPAVYTITPPFAEGKSAKVSVNEAQQLLCLGKPQGHMSYVKVLHVVTAFQVFMYIPFPCSRNKLRTAL